MVILGSVGLLPAEPLVLVLLSGSIPKFWVYITSLAGLVWLDRVPPLGNLVWPHWTGFGSGNCT